MLPLLKPSDDLEFSTTSAAAIVYFSLFRDGGGPIAQYGVATTWGPNAAQVCLAPDSGLREVVSVSLHNLGEENQTVRFWLATGELTVDLFNATLGARETLTYSTVTGWRKYSASGELLQLSSNVALAI